MLAIREYRFKKGLTQATLAEKCNVAPSTIAMWELGKRKPDVINLKKIAVILECSTDKLLEPIKVDENVGNGVDENDRNLQQLY